MSRILVSGDDRACLRAGRRGAGGGKRLAPAGGPTVYAWFPHQFNDFETRAIQWPAITHLSFRSVVIEPDGTLQEPQPRSKVKRLVDEAHAARRADRRARLGHHARQLLTVPGRHQDQAVKSLLEYVKANRLDGLDMDDETWQERNTVTGASNRPLVSGFFRKLSRVLKTARRLPGLLGFASGDRSAGQVRESWPDYQAIAAGIDGFCIMSYCMNPPTIGWTTGAQPVRGGGKVAGHARDYATCIHDYVAATGGRKDKLLLGVSNNLGGTSGTADPTSRFRRSLAGRAAQPGGGPGERPEVRTPLRSPAAGLVLPPAARPLESRLV